MAEYDVRLYDPRGVELAEINDFSALELVRVVNSIGALTVTLPGYYDLDLFRLDGRIAVFRRPRGGAWYLEGETTWLIRRVTFNLAANGEYQIKLLAYDAFEILHRRVVAYDASTAQADQAAPADNMMKTVVRENLGDLATDTDRDLSAYLSVAPYLDLGPFIDKQFPWKNVLAVLREIASTSERLGTYLAFDIVAPTISTLQFRTYTGQRGKDRRYPGQTYYPIGPQYGNLVNIERVDDHTNEVTFAYASSYGADVAIETAQDNTRIAESPFNRIETYKTATNTDTTASLEDEAQAALGAGLPKKTFAGDIESVDDYGILWGWGDRLTCDFGRGMRNCRADTIKISISGGVEKVTTRLKDEEEGV